VKKAVIVVPTYNESENIGPLLKALLRLPQKPHVLVVDDLSPDGTGDLAQTFARKNRRVRVLHRKGPRGRGWAGIAGFKAALAQGADYVLEMDADFSHDPRYIPDLLDGIQNADVVLGSRFVAGGRDGRPGRIRRLITLLAGNLERLVLGVGVRDPTSGYRCFRREVLESIGLDRLDCGGPSIVVEVLYRAHVRGFRIKEVPVVFEDRTRGVTKLNIPILLKTFFSVFSLRKKALFGQL